MARTSVLLGMALMLTIANASPCIALSPYSASTGSQSESNVSLAEAGTFCYNCSDLATGALIDTPVSSQPSPQSLPGNSSIMTTLGSMQCEEEAWVWRGKVKSRWESVGFDSGTFELFMRMKGAKTRSSLLDALSLPKDRLQLAHELGLDWKAVDYHIVRLNKYGLVQEDHAFGRVKLYRLTTLGEILLRLLKEFDSGIEKDARAGPS